MFKRRFLALLVVVLAILVGYFVYTTENPESDFAFKLGLDLNGGTHLIYEAETTNLISGDIDEAMIALRNVVERRVNIFGVSEPLVQIEKPGLFNEGRSNRLIVELPGVTDTEMAVKMIGETPILDFRLMNEFPDATPEEIKNKTADELFARTGLSGQYLKKASIRLDQFNQPTVLIEFNNEGKDLFAKITKENVGRNLAIFLDGVPISTPVIREEIRDGSAEISGNFSLEEARTLVRDLNYGALPVPIKLISTETIGATLGNEATKAGVTAGLYALVLIAIFLIFWYRLPGILASIALISYVAINLAVFKLIPVTLTAAGIAGFVLSIGMAVDANILIFERLKEELMGGRKLEDAVNEGFNRAWLSIRDSNISSIITAIILFSFASSSIVKGFALVFMIGVILSMLSALTISRTLLFAFKMSDGKFSRFLFLSGIKK